MSDKIPGFIGGYVGQSVPRREDRRLLLGRGLYVSDIQLPKMVHVAFARSSVPHARIRGVGTDAARTAPGVVFAASGIELKGKLPDISGMQVATPQAWRDRFDNDITIPDQKLLPDDKMRYVGEPYALVVADSRYTAEDAVELIEPDFEMLPAVPDCEAALDPKAALVHEAIGRNYAAWLHTSKGEGKAGLETAKHRIKKRFYHHRYAAMPMETRGDVAEYDERTDSIMVWSSTQVVHWVRREVANALGLPEERVRVIAPEVGGGFGVKGHAYPEDIIIPWLARELKRPVKWIEDRHEHILNSAHSRDLVLDLEAGFDDDGRIGTVSLNFLADSGAYSPVGAGITGNTVVHLLGPIKNVLYRIAIRGDMARPRVETYGVLGQTFSESRNTTRALPLPSVSPVPRHF